MFLSPPATGASPNPVSRFSANSSSSAATPPHEIAYVGDRLDNDLRPATTAGLRTIFVRRGPWGYITYQPGTADLAIDTLTELPDALKTLPAD
jgi:FMN phosphatase YigB (HAD superfamily)